jgi:hypothetical protein
MTLAALLHFTEAVLWSILLFLSIAGYGALLLRLFAIRLASIVLAAISGFGVIIFLGGVLNLLNAITPAVLIALTVLGLLAAILLRLKLTDSDADLLAR